MSFRLIAAFKAGLCALALLSLSACYYDTQPTSKIYDAENSLFLSNGSLLISGGDGLYMQSSASKAPEPIRIKLEGTRARSKQAKNLLGPCIFTGLAEYRDWVFASCIKVSFNIFKDNLLLAAKVPETGAPLSFRALASNTQQSFGFDQLSLPNGIAFTSNGDLLVADSVGAKVAKFQLEFSAAGTPRIVAGNPSWIDENSVSSPNGLRVAGQEVYLSDGSKILRYQLNTEAEIIGGGEIIDSGALVFEDLLPFCDGVAVADYAGGRVIYYGKHTDAEGLEYYRQDYATLPFSFAFPSSLAIGQAPLYSSEQLLVTEKGETYVEDSYGIGDSLSVAQLAINLTDPAICETIADAI